MKIYVVKTSFMDSWNWSVKAIATSEENAKKYLSEHKEPCMDEIISEYELTDLIEF
jgi:hypothetical protein